MAAGAELSFHDLPRAGTGHAAQALLGGVLLLLSAGCATRPMSQREWHVAQEGGETSLLYGRRGASHAEFAVVCDVRAGVADLVYHVGSAAGVAQGARTELLVAVGDSVDNLPAEVGTAPDGGLTVFARTVIPPAPVATWVGRQVTVGAVGRATLLTVPPDRRTVAAFLQACRR